MTVEGDASAGRARLSARGRKLVSLGLGTLFVVCFLVFLSALVLRAKLLDPQLYVSALTENDAYVRVYTEVLADPAMQELFKQGVGSELDLVVEELYAQLVAAGVLVLPPSALQSATESLIHQAVGYVRGDVPTLEGHLRLGDALDRETLSRRIGAAVVGAAAERQAADAAPQPPAGPPPDQAALRAYLSDLASGRIRALPETVASASLAGQTPVERARLADLLLERAGGADGQLRLQVEAALASNDLPGAVAAASLASLRPRLEAAAADLLSRASPEGQVDGLAFAAARLGQSRAQVVASLERARGAAATAGALILPLALIMLVLLAGIVWLNGQDLRSALASAGWTLTAAGGAALILWLVASGYLRSRAGAGIEASLGTVPGLERWVGDILGAIAGAVFAFVVGLALFWLAVGLLALAFAYSASLGAFLRRLLAPVWPYRRWVLAGLFALLVGLPLLTRIATARELAANPPCNGHPELCDRPVNAVVFASTHNAMSITQYGWLWPMQDGTVTDQLEAGVRGLLVDTHYLEDEEEESEFLASLSPAERAVAEEAIASFRSEGLEGVLLCHENCRLGATPLSNTLGELREFLETHPREVLVLIFQDEISAADAGQVVEAHGLVPYIYTHREGEPWPTLRQMIDANQRLIIMAENEGPPPDWYTNAWEVTEETPYTFVFEEGFSCEPKRGGTGKPFFLLNHWIQRIAPNRVDAAKVNAYDLLLNRARQCEAERGKLPNFIAINFYGQGDLFRVVDTLNGVGTRAEP